MDLTVSLVAVIVITGLISSMLSIVAKLIYDGIKAKRNGSNGNNQVSVNLALLVKDIDFNNLMLTKIERGTDRLVEHAVASNVHLIDLKTMIAEQTRTFRTLISALTTAMARLESKL
ncbi:hypothetical protein LCGC14_1228240 [marine sediment metagenome]|uniref:Uncharacterized protein n=1 Tax=marine sediment metagenome TaxID=412755 RepID=A0A0F9PDN0_9ZZZZ